MMQLKTLVLLVEDDNNFAALVFEVLTEAGYDAVHYTDANSAVEWLKRHKPDLVITDIGLPGISGIHLCRILKSEPATESIPIIVLSALGDESHKVEALRAGADDYLVKPFSGLELQARIEALLRRTCHGGKVGRVLCSGTLSMDLDAGQVLQEGRRLSLLPKEYALLAYFLSKRGHILSFRDIECSVWGLDSMATKETIKVTIHRLRGKLGEYGSCIESVPSFGYRWTDPE